jgi:predicted amidohydrolase
MDCQLGEVNNNLDRVEKLISSVKGSILQRATLFCLPELFPTGYNLGENLVRLAESIPGRTSSRLSDIARNFGIYIVGGLAEKSDELRTTYNTSVIISPDGALLGKYRKIQLAGEPDRKAFAQGQELSHFDTQFGRVGVLICYDEVFPELTRCLALVNCSIIAHCSAWYTTQPQEKWIAGGKQYTSFMIARAMENTVFWVSANRTGVEDEFTYVGHSCVVAPWGETLSILKDEEGVAIAKIDTDDLSLWREKFAPYLKERRPDLYRRFAPDI